MAFPAAPGNGDQHAQDGQIFEYAAASDTWSILTYPSYASISAAEAAFTPTAGNIIVVNNRALVYRGGADFEYPGRSDGPSGLWVPQAYRAATVVIVYHGDVDVAASPNSDWGWSKVGDVAIVAGETRIQNAGAAAYLQKLALGLTTVRHLMYMNAKVTAAGGSNCNRFKLDAGDGAGGGKTFNSYQSYLATPGDTRWTYDSNGIYAAGVGYQRLVCECDQTADCALMYHYDTQKLLNACRVADFVGAAGNERIYIGSYQADTGVMYVDGFPAITILEIP